MVFMGEGARRFSVIMILQKELVFKLVIARAVNWALVKKEFQGLSSSKLTGHWGTTVVG